LENTMSNIIALALGVAAWLTWGPIAGIGDAVGVWLGWQLIRVAAFPHTEVTLQCT
jgi:hypothetical protein